MQHEELIVKAAALAKSAPAQWADFLAAFAKYKEVHRDNLLNSPPDALQINQGRAQILSVVHDLLSDAVKNAEKMTGKRHDQR